MPSQDMPPLVDDPEGSVVLVVLVPVVISTDMVVPVPEAELVDDAEVVIPIVADALPASESVCDAEPVGAVVLEVGVVVLVDVITAVADASSPSRPLSPQLAAISSAHAPVKLLVPAIRPPSS